MNTIKKLLKFGECLNFSDENLKGRFVFQTVAGAGGTGGAGASEGVAKTDKPPVTPEATEAGKIEKPEAQKSAEEKRAETLAGSRAKLEAAKTATGTEATQKRLQEIADRKDAITEEKEHKIYPETKKLFGVKEPWVDQTLAIPEDKPYTLGPLDVTKQDIAQKVEDAMAKPNYAAILKDLMPDDMSFSQNNQKILRNVMTEIVDSYLHHVNPSASDALKYKDEVLLPRLENFITHFKQIAGNKKPIEMMILFSAFAKKIDPNFDFVNKDGVLQPEQLKNILLVSDPIAILDLFKKDQNLDKEVIDLNTDKVNRENELAIAQKKEVNIGEKLKSGEIKFTAKTITVPLEADKIDQNLKEEFAKAITDQNLDPNLRNKTVDYLMEKAKDLKQPGKKFNLSENGELTPVTEADEVQIKKAAEDAAKKATEQASTMAGNPDVKPGQESGEGWMNKISEVFSNFLKILAQLMEKWGLALGGSEVAKALKDKLKNWTPAPTDEELKETGKFESAMLKGIPNINKKNLAKLLEDGTEMRNHIFKIRKPSNLSWETYLFDKQKGRITAEERAKLEDPNKELKPSEISTMIMMKDPKAPEQAATTPTATPAVAPSQTPAATSPTTPEIVPATPTTPPQPSNPEVAANIPPTAAPKTTPTPAPTTPPAKP